MLPNGPNVVRFPNKKSFITKTPKIVGLPKIERVSESDLFVLLLQKGIDLFILLLIFIIHVMYTWLNQLFLFNEINSCTALNYWRLNLRFWNRFFFFIHFSSYFSSFLLFFVALISVKWSRTLDAAVQEIKLFLFTFIFYSLHILYHIRPHISHTSHLAPVFGNCTDCWYTLWSIYRKWLWLLSFAGYILMWMLAIH